MRITPKQNLPADDVYAGYHVVHHHVNMGTFPRPLAVIYLGRDGTFSLFKSSKRDSIHNTLDDALDAI